MFVLTANNKDIDIDIIYNIKIRVCGCKSRLVAGKTIHISSPKGCEHGAA